MEIVFLTTRNGKVPVQEYLDALDLKQAQKVAWGIETIEDLSAQGERIPTEYFTKLPSTDDIWEVRAIFGGNIFRRACVAGRENATKPKSQGDM